MKFHVVLRAGVCAAVLFLGAAAPVFAQPSAAAMEIRFQQLEKEIRRLTGQIEEQNYEIRQLKEQVEALKSAGYAPPSVVAEPSAGTEGDPVLSVSPSSGAEQIEEESIGMTSQSLGVLTRPAGGGEVVASEDEPAGAYDQAYSFIKGQDFKRAEAEFAAFLNAYPDHDLAGNAQYWFAETFYVRGDYDRAAREFAKGYQSYPKGGKAASNLLKLGMSLKGMGKAEDACIAFKQLRSEYTGASASVLDRAESEMEKIGCS